VVQLLRSWIPLLSITQPTMSIDRRKSQRRSYIKPEDVYFGGPASARMPSPPRRPAVTLTFDYQNISRHR